MASLLRIGWKIPSPTYWISRDHHGDVHHSFEGQGDSRQLYESITLSVCAKNSKQVAAHWSGLGASRGARFDIVGAHVSSLRKSGKHDEAALLTAISTGACWSGARRAAHGMQGVGIDLCPRCLATGTSVVETDLHRYWQCPCNLLGSVRAIVDTQAMARFAIAEAATFPLLWMRGIPSTQSLSFPLPANDIPILQVGHFALVDNYESTSQLDIYSDGSGGARSRNPDLRRCGWAWCVVSQSGALSFCRYAPLSGYPQTVPRAELSAVVDALETFPAQLAVNLHIDARYVVDTGIAVLEAMALKRHRASKIHFQGKALRAMLGPNSDLWQRFITAVENRNPLIELIWIKAHATTVQLWSGIISPKDHRGNAMADAFADSAAASAQLPSEVLDSYDMVAARSFKIRRRLIAVHVLISEFEKMNPPEKIPRKPRVYSNTSRLSLQQRIQSLKDLNHSPCTIHRRNGTILRCSKCMQHTSLRKSKAFCDLGPCVPIKLRSDSFSSAKVVTANLKRQASPSLPLPAVCPESRDSSP